MDKYSGTIIKNNRNCSLYSEHSRESVEGDIYELNSVGFRLWHFLTDKGFKGQLDLPMDKNSILMCFCTNGEIELNYSIEKKTRFQQSHNLFFLPNQEPVRFLAVDSNAVEVFAVILESNAFFNYFPVDGSPLFMDFKQKVQKEKEPVLLSSTNFQLSWDMKLLINSLTESDRVDVCKHIYFQAKIIELLGLQLEQFMTINSQEDRFKGLKKDELERIRKVKDMLSKNPEKSYTLLGLAHSVGTNDSTLKKHFKLVYGTTVFNYLNRCRMEKAHHILQNNDYKISHVAEEVGFRYASHFSAAFKKHYGYSPAVLKNVN